MMSNLIFVVSDQNGDLVGHMSFQEKKYICSPTYKGVTHSEFFFQDFEKPRKVPKLCLKISTSEVRMVDSIEHEDQETFALDDMVRGLNQKHEETAPALSCHTCGEQIYNEEFVNDEKLYCSEECMERESSVVPVDTTRRRVN